MYDYDVLSKGMNTMETTEQTKTVPPRVKLIKTLVSILGAGYSALLLYFAYTTFFFDIEYTNQVTFAIVGAVVAVAVCFLDYFTRESKFTCFFGMLNMVLLFPTVMFDWGNWPLLIPAAVVTLFGFFCCHMNETAKTVFGTLFLLLYIIGGVAFYFVTSFFNVRTIDTLIDTAASPSGAFRYYTLDVQNKASGKIVVYVQPNTLDKDNGMFTSKTTLKKMICQMNKPAEAQCSWDGENLYINGEVFFTESEYSMDTPTGFTYMLTDSNWTYTYFDLDYPLSETVTKITTKVREFFDRQKENKAGQSASDETGETSSEDISEENEGSGDTDGDE